jgi:arylsulfatase A-like enzyme
MKSFFKKLILGICALILAFLCIFVLWIYPDDQNIPELKVIVPENFEPWDFVGSVLKSKLHHSIDISDNEFKDFVNRADGQVEAGLLLESHRFTSKYQILAPLGTYPWRLEAMDGLAIPSGKTLTIDVPEDAEWLEFNVRDGGLSTVNVTIGNESHVIKTSSSMASLMPSKSLPKQIQKTIKKYLFIKTFPDLPRWQLQRIPLQHPVSHVTFKCESHVEICVVSDPSFFKKQSSRRLNQTVMIMIDTLRADALTNNVMPNISKLASEGVNFQKALPPGNMTSPSTNGVLACQTPSDLGLVAFAYAVGAKHREQFYQSGRNSFPAKLRNAGVTTAMIGNISVVSEVFGVGVSHGFEKQLLIEPEGYETPLAISEAIQWLKENQHKDYFLYVHLNNPHAPYKPPLHYLIDHFRGVSDISDYTSVIKWLYRGETAFSDRHVGRLLDYLKESKTEPNIVLTSDHGDQHSAKKFVGNEIGKDFEGAFFDHGATLLNDEISIPLIVRSNKGKIGVSQNHVSSLWLGKTILSLYGLTERDGDKCVGENLLDFLETRPMNSDYPIIGTEGFQARAVVMNNRYKYIKTYEPTVKRVYSKERLSGEKKSFIKVEQLYDLADDPLEMSDLTFVQPEILSELKSGFRKYFKIESNYELVLEAKGKATFTVRPGTIISDSDIMPQPTDALNGEFIDRTRLPIDYVPGQVLPRVEINGAEVPVKATTLKLPFPKFAVELPEEGWGWTRGVDGASVFVARIVDEKRGDRKISLGNPAFERVLREWGYINEN